MTKGDKAIINSRKIKVCAYDFIVRLCCIIYECVEYIVYIYGVFPYIFYGDLRSNLGFWEL